MENTPSLQKFDLTFDELYSISLQLFSSLPLNASQYDFLIVVEFNNIIRRRTGGGNELANVIVFQGKCCGVGG